MQLCVVEKTKLEIIELTFAQTLRGAISHPFAAGLIAIWFSHVAPVNELLIWFGAIALVTILRVCIFYAYKKYGNDKSARLWMHG